MDSPPDPKAYAEIVWKIVRLVPSGIVTTYGQVASMIPAPAGVAPEDYTRLAPVWVGKAMNAVSAADTPDIPWQRVINSQGGISLPEGSKVAAEQRARLEREGVTFGKNGRVDLNQYGWDGPSADWLAENKLLTPKPLRKNNTNPQQPRLF